MSHHKVEVRQLHYSYPDGREAIRNISLSIHHGESVGIIGANGAGKSTLLLLLTGILFPLSGEVLVGDIHVTKKTLPMIRQRLGMVLQDPDDQLFLPTVYDDVAFGPRNYGLNDQEIAERVQRALETVGISHLSDRAPFKLSGGEKRAASIATVLSLDPDILIMDEPTTGLDPRSRRKLIHLLDSFDHTKIIASHDLEMVLATCSRVILMEDGEVAASGPSEVLLRDKELLERCGLEVPLSLLHRA